MVPLESDCRDLTTTEDPLGKSRPTEEGENRRSKPEESGAGTGETGRGDEHPEQEKQGMTSCLSDFAKMSLAALERRETLLKERRASGSFQESGKPSKDPTESPCPGRP